MKIVYSFNKRGFEAEYWTREIAAASGDGVEFIPFNHDRYLHPSLYVRAQLLDNLYYEKDPRLLRLYADFERVLDANGADAVIVENCFPYHPDYLRRIDVWKVLRTSDGPIMAYDLDFAHLHAYDQVLYHSPAYSRDMGMEEKLRYCGARATDFWPLSLFDANYDGSKNEKDLLAAQRDIDVIFIGAMHVNKMPMFATVMKALRGKLRIHGLTNLKRNLYFNFVYGMPGWIRPVAFKEYVPLYQRAKIGINIHNRGSYSVGNYRLFDLPGNGVMQISDGDEYLGQFFEVGTEIESYRSAPELIEKIEYYLANDQARERIAMNGFRRVTRDYGIRRQMRRAVELIRTRMSAGRSNDHLIGPAGKS